MPEYNLTFLLPFVRSGLRRAQPRFGFTEFASVIWTELEKAQFKVRRQRAFARGNESNPEFAHNDDPEDLKQSTVEAWLHLQQRGFATPWTASFPFNLNAQWQLELTKRGVEWVKGADPMPEDVARYVGHLDTLAPGLDPIIREYVAEGLGSFRREQYFSAAVMLGAASEKEIYLLGDSMVPALQSAQHKKDLSGLLGNRSLYRLLTFIGDRLRGVSSPVRKSSNGLFDGAEIHLASLFESIRVQRNDAVHPNTGTVNELSVRMAHEAFPNAIQKAEKLRGWCSKNPNAL
jgi:hypothetical protein